MTRIGLLFIVALLAPGAAPAQDASGRHDAKYVESVAPRFADFAGSQANLESLATGLRHGSAITLTGADGATTTFTPHTRPMGYGNVTHALDLTSQRLAAEGITSPTPQQLRGTLEQVLQMRSDGMGWGQIRNSLGLRPGAQASTPASPRSVSSPSGSPRSAGIVTAGGGASVASPGAVRSAGHGRGGTNGRASGHARGGKP